MLVQHFWLLCGLWCGVVNSLFVWKRLQPHVREGKFSPREVNTFALALSASVLVPMLIFWGIQLSATATTSPNFLTWPAPQRNMALGLQVLLWTAMLVFIFAKGGAHLMSTYVGVGYKGWVYRWFFSPPAFKVMTLATVISGAGTAAFALLA